MRARPIFALLFLGLASNLALGQTAGMLGFQGILRDGGGSPSTLINGNGSNLAFTGRHFRQNRNSVLKSGKDLLRWQDRRRQTGNPGLKGQECEPR